MSLPLDVFDSYLRSAYEILRMEKGEGESAAEKFDRMARERLSHNKGSEWWE